MLLLVMMMIDQPTNTHFGEIFVNDVKVRLREAENEDTIRSLRQKISEGEVYGHFCDHYGIVSI